MSDDPNSTSGELPLLQDPIIRWPIEPDEIPLQPPPPETDDPV